MKQFLIILNFELKYYFKNKVFIGITAFLMVLIAVVMFFPQITALFETGDTEAELSVMLIKMDDITQADIVKKTFSASFLDYDVQITDNEIDVIKDKITSGEVACAFVMNETPSFTYYVDNLSIYDTNLETATEALQQIYQMNELVNGGMPFEDAKDVMNIQIEGKVENLGKDQVQNFFYTYIMIFALYMVILLYGQLVATEKSSRAMELLITSVKPTSMMFGKVIASCLTGFIQLSAVFGSAFVLYNINKRHWQDNILIESIFNIPLEVLAYMLVFFVLGFLIYAFMYSAIGSTASKLEDINTSVMPITILFIIAFLVVIFSMSSGNVDNVLMAVCSYIPFTSPMAMFTRICMSTVLWHEVAISIFILIGSTFGIGILSAKIYRIGVLMYGTTPKIGSIIKAIREV